MIARKHGKPGDPDGDADKVAGYLARLRAELRKRWVPDARILEETRGHLSDAAERAVQSGLSPADAEDRAIQHFGSADTVATHFAREEFAVRNRLLMLAAVVIGLAIAYIDSRPHWDDTGITVGLMVTSAGLLGLIAPQRPWLWALAIGIWIPAHALAQHPEPKTLLMLIVLAFPFAGAYAGMAMRRMLH
jgi:hypothetical protein